MRNARASAWVVYSFSMNGSPDVMRAVCEEAEWEAIDRSKPGFYTLVQAGIANEGEAERLARGTAGEVRPRVTKAAVRSWARDNLVGPRQPAAE